MFFCPLLIMCLCDWSNVVMGVFGVFGRMYVGYQFWCVWATVCFVVTLL